MKFLRNTATDFFAHNARFLFEQNVIDDCGCDNPEAEKEVKKQEEKKKVIDEQRADLKKAAKDCTPKGIWSTKVQNERAGTIELKHEQIHLVEYGDTLGSIVKGMTGKLDYSRPVLYRSNRLTPSRIAQWNKTNTCFPIPNNLGQTEQPFDLRVVNAIYPGQIVYIEEINGVKYIIVDDGKETSSSGGSGKPESVPGGTAPNPEKPNPEGECDIQTPEIVSDCEADECKHEFTEIWNGIEGGDPKALEALHERTGIAVESTKEAREAFVKLYGQKEWAGVEKDGVYTVLEKHYNPKSSVPLWSSLKEMFGNKSLADTFREAGYENADELVQKFTGAVAGYENINSNAAKFAAVAEDKHDGATVDALIRIGAGAVIAVGMAAALGTPLTAPLVLAGVPLMKFRTGIKRFEKTTNVNTIYELFTKPDATVEEYEDCCGELVDVPVEGQEKPYTYIELQKKAIGDVEIVSYLAKDAIDANVALKRGPYQTPMVDLTPEEEALYKAQAESISETEGDVDKVLDELAKNGYYFEEGAEHEADYASRAKKFKLGRLGLSTFKKTSVNTSEGLKRMNIRAAFDFYMGQATSSLGYKSRKESYEKAMDLLVDEFNTVAQDELHTVWGEKKLTLTSLDRAFQYDKEFELGSLPNKNKYNWERTLCVKFHPTTPGQANNTAADGTWSMYVKQKDLTTGEISLSSEIEYRSASALIGKMEKHITDKDIATLRGSKDNMYGPQEQREILKRLDFFDLMVGQMAQMNETKDQMQLSTSNQKVMNELTRVESLLNVNMRCKGTEVETQERYQYRVAVGAKLGKYKNFAEFKAGVEKFGDIYKFSPAVMGKIEKVYMGEPSALDALVANKDFQMEMALFTQRMECINEYLALDDLDACAAYVQRHTYFSGETAMRQSTNETLSFGDAYLVYLVGKGLISKEVSKVITETIDYTTGAKNEAGELIVYTMEMEKEIIKKIPAGTYNNETIRKAIIALFGGRISNEVIDHWKNKPEN
jgi:hypothetical protein